MAKKKRKLPRKGSVQRDCWSLDVAFFDWVVPRLRHLAKTTHGYPTTLGSIKKWQRILNTIADGFDQCRQGSGYWMDQHDKDKLAESFRLFMEWHGAMWD